MIHPLNKLIYILLAITVLYYIFPHLVPFLIALILAVLLEPLVLNIQKCFKIKRLMAVTLNFFIFLAVSLGLIFLILTKVINEAVALSQQFPQFSNEVGERMENLILQTKVIFKSLPPETIQVFQKIIRDIVNVGGKIGTTGATALVGTAKAIPNLFILFIVTVVSFYFICLELPDLKRGFLQMFSDRAQEKVEIILYDINQAVIGFVRGQMFISLITYIFILLGLTILRIRYSIVIALVITVVDILPILGTGSIMIPWSVFLFIVNKNSMALGILVLYIFIILLRRIIEPKILGQNIGLSPLSTVISMYVGYKTLGMGGFLAGPALCIIFMAMRKTGLFQKKFDF